MSKKIVIKNKLAVKEIIDRFENKIVYRGNLNANYITSPIFNRCGLQLASPKSRMKMFEQIESMVVWGTNESNFIASCKKDHGMTKVKEMFKNILSLEPPLIIICEGFDFTDQIVAAAKKAKSNATIVKCKLHSHMLYFQMAAWINKLLATYQYVHATVVQINGIGVMIQGESGIGKSEVALQLIKRGALFVADDAVEITNLGNRLYARPNKLTSGFMEVRGVGMIDISRAVGINNVNCTTIAIDIVVNLLRAKNDDVNSVKLERLRENQEYKSIIGVKLPTYSIPITAGRDISNMIEAAVSDYKLRLHGYNCARTFNKNLRKMAKEEE